MIVGQWGGWYQGTPFLTGCTACNASACPPAPPSGGGGKAADGRGWIDAARAHCDSLGAKACGGFLLHRGSGGSATVSSQGGESTISYCMPGSFVEGTPTNSTDIGYPRSSYSPNPVLGTCDLLTPQPKFPAGAAVTVAAAEELCDALPNGACGGFTFVSASTAAARAQESLLDVPAAASASFCHPGTWGTLTPNSTTAVGYPRGGVDASGLIGGMGGGNHGGAHAPEGDCECRALTCTACPFSAGSLTSGRLL